MYEMKDSGIEWIGKIPVEWETIKFWQAIIRLGTGLNPRDNFQLSRDDKYYYVTIKNFKNGKLFLNNDCDKIDKKAWTIIQRRSDLKKGDILFASISKDGQAYIISEFPDNWNINESVFCIRINKNVFDNKYFYYQIINVAFYDSLQLDATGTTFQSIKQNKLKKSTLVMPSLFEQQKISTYLDDKCTKINRIIERQQKIIDKLKEYKQSIITEAVTNGLNPDVKMKDSGIEWIGEIPENWRKIKLKYLVSFIESGVSVNAGQDKADDNELGVLKTSSVSKFVFDIHQNKSINKDEECHVSCPVCANTLIVSRMNTPELVGACGFVDKSYSNIFLPDRLWQVHFNTYTNVKYIWYYLRSKCVRFYISSLSTGTSSSMQNISQGQFNDIIIVLPMVNQQHQIIDYLDKKCFAIDSAIEKKQAIIEKLTAYKKSLIYEVVTGKKEV